MFVQRGTSLYRQDVQQRGHLLSAKERENLIRPYLPSVPTDSDVTTPCTKSTKTRRFSVREFFKTHLHLLLFTLIHTLFSAYIRLRQAIQGILNRFFAILYYHHRTPELIRKDIKALSRLPEHLSVILELEDEQKGGAALDVLLDEVAEISAWCACAGIPILSVYERTGILKGYIATTHRLVTSKLHAYFGRHAPSLRLAAPHMNSYHNENAQKAFSDSLLSTDNLHLTLHLLSSEDGRESLVDLTKTLAEMAQRSKLSPSDISVDLVDAELSEGVMKDGDPDLLLLFSPQVMLKGYPPWQLRLTEIFCCRDNNTVEYQVFLRALHKYSKATMRFGR
ncbi:MAG: hypothetical protein M1829_006940 [Trizodia sp. TS-e1964]|nr:MAG: hypothetical protein M1829_006940 [Trizodia sp. TS-e1964]